MSDPLPAPAASNPFERVAAAARGGFATLGIYEANPLSIPSKAMDSGPHYKSVEGDGIKIQAGWKPALRFLVVLAVFISFAVNAETVAIVIA